jgi:hypothetical protein
MEERERIIVILVVVVIFNLIDRFLIHPHKGLTDFAVYGSISIAIVLYLILIYFFGKKHLN